MAAVVVAVVCLSWQQQLATGIVELVVVVHVVVVLMAVTVVTAPIEASVGADKVVCSSRLHPH